MRSKLITICMLAAFRLLGEVRYVAPLGLAQYPYTNWLMAATNIQDAVDACTTNDIIRVTNGVYRCGGRNGLGGDIGHLSNRVFVTMPLTIESVNGPASTIIEGQANTEASTLTGIRCLAITHPDVYVSGFTLSNGHTSLVYHHNADRSGGGAFLYAGGTLSNCVIVANHSSWFGGGVCTVNGGDISACGIYNNTAQYGGGLYCDGKGVVRDTIIAGNSAYSAGGVQCNSERRIMTCAVYDNRAQYGGGAVCTAGGRFEQCTITDNIATNGGGLYVYDGAVSNCIVWLNCARAGTNLYREQGIVAGCCSPDLGPDNSNIANEPHLLSATHLASYSACIAAGLGSNPSTDIDHEAWRMPPSMGCDEVWTNNLGGALSVAIGVSEHTVAAGAPVRLVADIAGKVRTTLWDFGDGCYATDTYIATHIWQNPCTYLVRLMAYNDDHTNGVISTTLFYVVGEEFFVDQNSVTPTYPHTSWTTAARTIQAAVDAVVTPGSVVWVSNGVYNTGGRPWLGSSLTNRVCISKAVMLRSISGSAHTSIVGQGGTNGGTARGAVRCLYIASKTPAHVSGFTLSNGHTLAYGEQYDDTAGGGAFLASCGVISNCTIIGNVAATRAGGVMCNGGGEICDSVIGANTTRWFGGGVACENGGVLQRCAIITNSAFYGGGVYCTSRSAGNNLLIRGNSAQYGGGLYFSFGGAVSNATITDNQAPIGGGCYLFFGGALCNSIIHGNGATNTCTQGIALMCAACCCPDLTHLVDGNITNDPLFVNASGNDFRLLETSPCINAGTNAAWMWQALDLEGNPRIWNEIVDIGTYEYIPEPSCGLIVLVASACAGCGVLQRSRRSVGC